MTLDEIEIDRIERVIRVINLYLTGEKKYKSHAMKQRKEDEKRVEVLNARLIELKK